MQFKVGHAVQWDKYKQEMASRRETATLEPYTTHMHSVPKKMFSANNRGKNTRNNSKWLLQLFFQTPSYLSTLCQLVTKHWTHANEMERVWKTTKTSRESAEFKRANAGWKTGKPLYLASRLRCPQRIVVEIGYHASHSTIVGRSTEVVVVLLPIYSSWKLNFTCVSVCCMCASQEK